MLQVAISAFNLAILLAILVYYLRQPLKSFIYNRHLSVREDLKQAQEQLRRAQEQYEDFSARLKAVSVEVTSLRNQSRQDAELTRARVADEAKNLSQQIVADARTAAAALVAELQGQLTKELAARVLSRAEVMIQERLTAEDRSRIRHEFSRQVETAS